MDHQHLSAPENALITAPKSSELDCAIHVAHRMLATYGGVGHSDIGALAQAQGALAESLRIMLRALGAEPAAATEQEAPQRCPAAHHDDPTPCSGAAVVTVLDAHNAGANGCEHHGARILASLAGGRVYALPDAPAGSAIRVFKAAGTLRPFCWYEGGGQK
ncbi:hypothetical protein ABZ890_08250 [Streptomyces sp. NPDC046984]|uniref:hypothetical protein n=1 Tax=Streptomyces sp. NPDC046984 TaxID=3155138 RepID=UPI0033F63094